MALADPEQTFDKTVFVDELQKFRGALLKQHEARQRGLMENINPT